MQLPHSFMYCLYLLPYYNIRIEWCERHNMTCKASPAPHRKNLPIPYSMVMQRQQILKVLIITHTHTHTHLNCVKMSVNQICGDHFIVCSYSESFCYIPETNTKFSVNYISIKNCHRRKQDLRYLATGGELGFTLQSNFIQIRTHILNHF